MKSLDDLLGSYRTLANWVRALSAFGVTVTVLQRFPEDAEMLLDGVRFLLVRDAHPPHLPKWRLPRRFHDSARRVCQPTRDGRSVVHFNSLQFPLQLRALRAALPGTAIVVQHHAERPATGLRGRLQAWGLHAADAFLFAAEGSASPWVDQGLITRDKTVYEVMEGSTNFRRQDRSAARARTCMTGDPVVLWVGRLIRLKDPLTVLDGFELILKHAPGARLYMVYGTDDLLAEVRARIAHSAALASAVVLLGRLPHADLEAVYSSADYFVLGSHYEGSGYALAEALACGVVPVVTRIASFHAMTDRGRLGASWTPGEGAAFAEAFFRARREPLAEASDRAVRFFDEQLSWPAIARKAIRAYCETAARRANA